jgi:hypothetical protein
MQKCLFSLTHCIQPHRVRLGVADEEDVPVGGVEVPFITLERNSLNVS